MIYKGNGWNYSLEIFIEKIILRKNTRTYHNNQKTLVSHRTTSYTSYEPSDNSDCDKKLKRTPYNSKDSSYIFNRIVIQ